MIIQFLIIALPIITGAMLIGHSFHIQYWNMGISAESILYALVGTELMILPLIVPHPKQCTCNICYEPIGNEQGMELYMDKNKEIYYYDKTKNQYIEIIQEDGTNYTYNEYTQKQLNEVK